ncbi:MAG: serine/threonine protein kinase [Myxococcales bacterium]|nr:serine/threonine protein kinase [Myxococcales bacterium]
MSSGRRQFRILEEIAEGGFGKVYLAEQLSTDGFKRIVAVKILHAKWSTHDEVVMRTRDEARLLGLIRHQSIVKVEDLTSIDGKCALVMEYLEGVDLKWMMQFLTDKGMAFPRKALFEIMAAVANALDAAYNGVPLSGGDPLHVIHRDLKPSNIFATVAGGVKVLDFGTARANFAEREAQTQALSFGSQGYMAPERMLGEEDTAAADVFSLGITLYELLTLEGFGRIPPRPNKFARKAQECAERLPLDGTDEWCQQVRDTVRLMMSYDPTQRPTAKELVEMMELLAEGATDMGLRKFSRQLVTEAKEALPKLDSDDPLTGKVVEEDVSGSTSTSSSSRRASSSAPTVLQPPPKMPAGVRSTLGPTKSVQIDDPSSVERNSLDGSVDSAPNQTVMVAAVGGVALVVAAAFLVVVVGLGALAWWPADGTDAPTDDGAETSAGLDAGRVVVQSKSAGPRIDTILDFGDPRGGQIELVGPDGFKAEWNGREVFDVPLPSGLYKAVVTTASGKKLRLKNFRVEPNAKRCAFTFRVSRESWEGSCQ